MYRFCLLYASIFLLLFSVMNREAYASSASLKLSPRTGIYSEGTDFTLDVALDTAGIETVGTDLMMKYDKDMLDVLDIRPGSLYSTYVGKSIDNTQGTLRISGIVTPGTVYKGSGTFVTIVAHAKRTGTADFRFAFVANERNDSNVAAYSGDVLGTVGDGQYVISPEDEQKHPSDKRNEGNSFLNNKKLKRFVGSFKFPIILKEIFGTIIRML